MAVKIQIRESIHKTFKEKINETAKEKTKVEYFMDGKKDWTPGKPAKYMNKLNRNQASTIFKTRTRMLPLKGNQKNEYTNKEGKLNITCRMCNDKDETQKHILEECLILRKETNPITKEMVFEEDTEKLKTTANEIIKMIETMENANMPKP